MKKTVIAGIAVYAALCGAPGLKAQDTTQMKTNRSLTEKAIYLAPVIENPSYAQFKEILAKNRLVVVELGLETCAPCIKFKRAVKEIFSKDKRASELTFVYLDASTSAGKKIFAEYVNTESRTVPRTFLAINGEVDKTKDHWGAPLNLFYIDSFKVSQLDSYGYADLFKREFDTTLTISEEQAFSAKMKQIANSPPSDKVWRFTFKGLKFAVSQRKKGLLSITSILIDTPVEGFAEKKYFFEWIDREVKNRTQPGH